MMTATNQISENDDIIDSRDVIARIEELSELNAAEEDSEEETEELVALRELAAEASDYAADWEYGETLIRDSYFERYAEELADDIGAVDANATWPHTCIDWERAARELQIDYTSVEFRGVTYWIR